MRTSKLVTFTGRDRGTFYQGDYYEEVTYEILKDSYGDEHYVEAHEYEYRGSWDAYTEIVLPMKSEIEELRAKIKVIILSLDKRDHNERS